MADSEDICILAQMLTLASQYVEEQDEPTEGSNVTVMQDVQKALIGLLNYEAAEVEPDEPEDERSQGLVSGVQERSLPFDVGGDGKTLSGYFAKWNEWANVNGQFMERFTPGSMDDSMRSGRMKVIYDHGQDSSLGRKPIASVRSVVDDGIGAKYDTELLDAPYVDALLPGLRAGLYGASFRFRALEKSVNRYPEKSDYNPEGLPDVTARQRSWPPSDGMLTSSSSRSGSCLAASVKASSPFAAATTW